MQNSSRDCRITRTLAKIAIMVDASDIAIGASLQQSKDDMWKPLVYFSRKITPTKRKYCKFDRELTGFHETVK